MTKNELLQKIEELGYNYTYDRHWDKLRISPTGEPKSHYISIGNCEFKVHDGYMVSSERSKKLVRYILDYLDTPIEEREEEKKYRLKVPKEFLTIGGNDYLNVNTLINKCVFGDPDNCSIFKTIFTQKEIDEMPFDTSFFTKEEVY